MIYTKTTSAYKHAKPGDDGPKVFTWDVYLGAKAHEIMVADAAESEYTQLPSADGGELIVEFSKAYKMWIIWHN